MKRHETPAIASATPKEMRARLLAAARGEHPFPTKVTRVWASPGAVLRLLTDDNRKLLAILAQERPRSVSALAERLGRDQGNVSRALSPLVEAGFVRLVQDGRERRPEVMTKRLRFDLDLENDRLAIA